MQTYVCYPIFSFDIQTLSSFNQIDGIISHFTAAVYQWS